MMIATDVLCTWCGAKPGFVCRTRSGRLTLHVARENLMRIVASVKR